MNRKPNRPQDGRAPRTDAGTPKRAVETTAEEAAKERVQRPVGDPPGPLPTEGRAPRPEPHRAPAPTPMQAARPTPVRHRTAEMGSADGVDRPGPNMAGAGDAPARPQAEARDVGATDGPSTGPSTGPVRPGSAAPSLKPAAEPAPPAAESNLSDTELRRLTADELEDELARVDVLKEEEDPDLQPEAVMTKLQATSMSPRHQVEAWLAAMVKADASDLILRAGGRPSTRIDGRIGFLPGRVPAAGALLEVLTGVVGEERMSVWREHGSVDAALYLDGLGRFRLNAYRQMGDPAIVLRRVASNPPDLVSLELPTKALHELAKRKRGLVLVTGIAGSGKSTTLSALIEYMNRTMERHIITLEDPVECLFKEKRCVISQREVGTDCPTFHEGLRHALRQSPDVILIGEMRDQQSLTAALDAAETGHLVMSTLHTVNAPQTLDRVLGFYKAERHAQVRMRLAENLAAVLSQRLLPRSSGGGMVPACELLVSTPHIRELLEEGQTGEIGRVIELVSERGLISFNQSLKRLVEERLVELRDALAASDRPEELILALRGITKGNDRSVQGAPRTPPAGGEGSLRISGR